MHWLTPDTTPGAQTWPCQGRLAKDQRVEDYQPYAGETTMAINVLGGCCGFELLLPNARRMRNCLYSLVLFTRHLRKDRRSNTESMDAFCSCGEVRDLAGSRTWLRHNPVIAPSKSIQRHVAAAGERMPDTATTGDES